MSEKENEEKAGIPAPEKPNPAELSDNALEQVSGGMAGRMAEGIATIKTTKIDQVSTLMDGFIKQ